MTYRYCKAGDVEQEGGGGVPGKLLDVERMVAFLFEKPTGSQAVIALGDAWKR